MKISRREFVEAALAAAGCLGTATSSRLSAARRRPLRREISAARPLIVLEGGVPAWELLPEEFRPYCALQYAGGTGLGSPPSLFAVLEETRAKGIPVILSVQGDEADAPPTRLGAVEKAFEEFSNLIGCRCCELSCGPGFTPSERSHLIDFIQLCGHYRALINWQDMGYPYQREHIFMQAGRDRELFNTLRKNGDSVILTDKMNGWGKYFETMSLVLGMWTSGIVAHWGFNAEDWWWFEQGYGKRFLPSKGRRGYARLHGHGFAATKGWDFASAVSCPDIFYAQNVLYAIAGGATVYSFEMPSHAFACPDRAGVFRLTPAWKNAIYPLLKAAVDAHLIPTRRQVVAKMKVAYQDSGAQGTELDSPGEQLYRPLYGTREPDAEILARDLSSAIIPRSGRYYFLPVIPKLATARARAQFPHIIRPHQFADGQKERAYFDKIYPAESSGEALALHLNRTWFVTNWHENQDIAQDFRFRLALAGGSVELSGRLRPHSLLLAMERPRQLFLQVNNYLVKTHIWDKPLPETFDAQRYLQRYVTNPDDKGRRITMLQLAVLGEGTPALTHKTRHGTVRAKWDAASKTMQVVLKHNGPVDLTFTL
ncbi:MAG: hypothetical protein M1404_00240 [Acidobacteria bacterium]|nr:hypothetical protein [Acidobacteriota bacterium]